MRKRYIILIEILPVVLILLFSFSAVFSEDVNVILKDNGVIKGNLIGKTAGDIIVQETEGKLDTIHLSDIQGVFDSATGDPVDLSVNPRPSNRIIIYRPKHTVIEGPRNAIAVDILGAALGSLRLSYERAFSDWFSARLDAAYGPNYFWGSGVALWSATLYGRFYVAHYNPWSNTTFKGLGGPFFEIGAGYEGATINYAYSDFRGSAGITGSFPPAPAVKFVFGDKILFGEKNGLYLEPYAGYEASFGSWNVNYSGTGAYSQSGGVVFPYVEGLGEGTLFGIDLGYAF